MFACHNVIKKVHHMKADREHAHNYIPIVFLFFLSLHAKTINNHWHSNISS